MSGDPHRARASHDAARQRRRVGPFNCSGAGGKAVGHAERRCAGGGCSTIQGSRTCTVAQSCGVFSATFASSTLMRSFRVVTSISCAQPRS